MAALEKQTNNYNKNDDEEAALCKQLEKKKVLTSSDSPERHVNITQKILISTFKTPFKDDLSCDTRIAHNSDPSDNNDDGVTDDTLPAIKLSSAQKDHLIAPFRYSLIAKVLGRKVRYYYFQQRLLHLWSPMVGILKITELGNGFFLLKFSDPSDCEKVLKGVPWLIDGHYIILSPWVPDFRPSATVISHAVVWVRLPELPIEYYEKEMLIDIASAIGRVVKIDAITERQESGRFARLCIELDLNRPLLPYIKLGRLWQRVEYEYLHVICFQCGRVGHLQQHCLQPPSANVSPTDHQVSLRANSVSSCPQETTDACQNLTASSSKHTTYGPWLQVPHRWHQRQRQSAKDQGKQQSQVPSFNIVNRTEPKSSGSRSQVLEKGQILKEPVPSIGKSTMTSVSINSSHTTNAGQKNPLVQKQHLQSGEGTSSSAVNKEAYTQVENMPITVINLLKPEEAAAGKIGSLLGLSSPPLSNLLEDALLLPQTQQTNCLPLSHISSSSNDAQPSITKQEEPSPEQVVSLSPSASFISTSTAVKHHSYQATNSAIITPPPAQKTSHQGNQPYPLTLKISPSQLPAMSATSIKLYSEAMQRSVIQCEIDSKPVEMIEPSTEGRPKVFTIKSTISKVDICASISPLPTVNTNQHSISFFPSPTDRKTTKQTEPKTVLSWNCRGAGDQKFMQAIKALIQQHKPSVVILFEARISGTDADQVIKEIGFSSSYCIDPAGFAGGIWLLWQDVEVGLNSSTSENLHVTVYVFPDPWNRMLSGTDTTSSNQMLYDFDVSDQQHYQLWGPNSMSLTYPPASEWVPSC